MIELSSYFVRQFSNNVYDCVNHIVGILMENDSLCMLQMPCFKEIDKEVTQLNQYIQENNDVERCRKLLIYRMVWGEVLRQVGPQKENGLFKKLHEVDKALFDLQNWYLETFYNVPHSAINKCEYFVDDVTGEVKRSSTGEVITEPLQNDAKRTGQQIDYSSSDIFNKAVKDVVVTTECSWICREGEKEEKTDEKYKRYSTPIWNIVDNIADIKVNNETPQARPTGDKTDKKQIQARPTRQAGRPSKPFNDYLIGSEEEKKETLRILHGVVKGKYGRDAVLFFVAAMEAGKLLKPTHTAVETEFGNIGNRQVFNKYIGNCMYGNEEIERIKSLFD